MSERLLPQAEPAAGTATAPPPRGGSAQLEGLRARAESYAQTARQAIDRALSAGDPEKRLRELRNVGGQ